MSGQSIISLISVSIALVAVCVAVWQARVNARSAERANALHLISQIFGEWRSTNFHRHRSRILYEADPMPAVSAFESLPEDWRESAYTVCYFCDYVGMLAAFDIIKEDLIIAVMGTQLMQLWKVMGPYIKAERDYRGANLPADTPRGFLPYYENLVRRILELGGSQSTIIIRARLGIRPLIEEPLAEEGEDASREA